VYFVTLDKISTNKVRRAVPLQ